MPPNPYAAPALDAFITSMATVEALHQRLGSLLANHFYTYPDRITWANVGDINRCADALREALAPFEPTGDSPCPQP